VRVDTAFRVSGRSPQQDRTESQILRHQAPGQFHAGLNYAFPPKNTFL